MQPLLEAAVALVVAEVVVDVVAVAEVSEEYVIDDVVNELPDVEIVEKLLAMELKLVVLAAVEGIAVVSDEDGGNDNADVGAKELRPAELTAVEMVVPVREDRDIDDERSLFAKSVAEVVGEATKVAEIGGEMTEAAGVVVVEETTAVVWRLAVGAVNATEGNLVDLTRLMQA
jgi:hypothetical protein